MTLAVTAEVASSSLVVPAIIPKQLRIAGVFPHRCKKVHLFPSLLPTSAKISTCSGRCSRGALIIGNQESNDCVLGLALGRRDRLRVSVHGRQRRGILACENVHRSRGDGQGRCVDHCRRNRQGGANLVGYLLCCAGGWWVRMNSSNIAVPLDNSSVKPSASIVRMAVR
jgi:hypothetical protein